MGVYGLKCNTHQYWEVQNLINSPYGQQYNLKNAISNSQMIKGLQKVRAWILQMTFANHYSYVPKYFYLYDWKV